MGHVPANSDGAGARCDLGRELYGKVLHLTGGGIDRTQGERFVGVASDTEERRTIRTGTERSARPGRRCPWPCPGVARHPSQKQVKIRCLQTVRRALRSAGELAQVDPVVPRSRRRRSALEPCTAVVARLHRRHRASTVPGDRRDREATRRAISVPRSATYWKVSPRRSTGSMTPRPTMRFAPGAAAARRSTATCCPSGDQTALLEEHFGGHHDRARPVGSRSLRLLRPLYPPGSDACEPVRRPTGPRTGWRSADGGCRATRRSPPTLPVQPDPASSGPVDSAEKQPRQDQHDQRRRRPRRCQGGLARLAPRSRHAAVANRPAALRHGGHRARRSPRRREIQRARRSVHARRRSWLDQPGFTHRLRGLASLTIGQRDDKLHAAI